MRALIGGFLGFFAVIIGLVFLIQYPALFWLLLFVLILALLFGFINGRKQTPLNDPDRIKRRNTAFSRKGEILEDDIVHQHQPNGRPFEDRGNTGLLIAAAAAGAAAAYILKPDAEEVAPVVEPDPEIENAAAMYYEGNDVYNEEEGEY